jgi:dopamine beta-monooxygenase
MYRSLPFFLFLLQVAAPLVTAQDPSSYFGGSDNEAYTAWLQTVSYNKSTFLASTNDEGKGVALHWTTDDTIIRLAVATQATGWVAFGLGETGSMRGADIVMFIAETNELIDSYVLDQLVKPFPDDCQSWTLVDSTVEGDFIIFEATRLLDTGDTQDRVFVDDSNTLVAPARVLAAWGDSAEPSYHGSNNARGVIRFFGNASSADEYQTFARVMEEEAEGSFAVKANDFIIPAERTTYQNFCLSRDDIIAMNVTLDQDLHTIGIKPIVDPRSKKYVHHYVLTASSQPWNSSLSCDEEFLRLDIAYVWAPGDAPLNLPENIGSPLGSSGFQSFSLQIHYDNPDLDENVLDSSGVRLYYTSKKREFDLGVFPTGDPNVVLYGEIVSANRGLSQHVFKCDETCSSNYVAEPVTVIREHLHMHMSGVSMVNAQIRDGDVIRQGQVEFWDFGQQGGFDVVQPPFTIKSGDSFRTVCNYNANNNETFGLGSEQEMCIAYLYYYPRQLAQTELGEIPYLCGIGFEDILPGCEVTYSVTPSFSDFAQLERSFGTASTTCPIEPSTVTPNSKPSVQGSNSSGNDETSSSVATYAIRAFPGLLAGSFAISLW